MGCGVACVAFVLGVKYGTARPMFHGLRGDPLVRGYSRRALVAALRRGGRSYAVHGFGAVPAASNRSARIPDGAIVFVRDATYPYGHYFVHASRRWMDPLRPALRRQLPAVPRSYIAPV